METEEGDLVEAITLNVLAGDAFLFAFYRGSGFTLFNRGGFFVEFAATGLGEYTGLFAGTPESAKNQIKRFVLFNAH